MTIKEAHKAWGGKADHLLTFHHTMAIFSKGFCHLDLDKPLDYYGKKDYAKALKASELSASNAYMAASVMCNVLKEYSTIGFTAEDVVDAMQEADVVQPQTEKTERKADVAQPKTEKTKQKTKTNMKSSTKPKSVQQLDPTSGKVICTYNSISEAQSKIGVKNIYRAIENGTMAGGYKWKVIDETAARQPHPHPSPKGEGSSHPLDIRHQTSLADLSDQELIDEMKRRGWKGNVEIVVRVTL